MQVEQVTLFVELTYLRPAKAVTWDDVSSFVDFASQVGEQIHNLYLYRVTKKASLSTRFFIVNKKIIQAKLEENNFNYVISTQSNWWIS